MESLCTHRYIDKRIHASVEFGVRTQFVFEGNIIKKKKTIKK